ncbi:MAG TPA: hypothetical protein D7I02_02975, partial [Candidatus Poseidoniales archaeon]
IIQRCPECRRILRESACLDHGPQQGVEDLRLKFVVDNGIHNASLILGKEPSEKLLGNTQEAVKEIISKTSQGDFLTEVRNNYLARKVTIHGRSLVDAQGAMILAEGVTFDDTSNETAANLVMEEWGVLL